MSAGGTPARALVLLSTLTSAWCFSAHGAGLLGLRSSKGLAACWGAGMGKPHAAHRSLAAVGVASRLGRRGAVTMEASGEGRKFQFVPYGEVRPTPPWRQPMCKSQVNLPQCHPMLVAFVWNLTKETIVLPLGCLQGGRRWWCLSARDPSVPNSSVLSHQTVRGVSDSPVCFFDSPGLHPDYSQVEHLGCVVQRGNLC